MKDDMAKSVTKREGIPDGIVCSISVVEPCKSF